MKFKLEFDMNDGSFMPIDSEMCCDRLYGTIQAVANEVYFRDVADNSGNVLNLRKQKIGQWIIEGELENNES